MPATCGSWRAASWRPNGGYALVFWLPQRRMKNLFVSGRTASDAGNVSQLAQSGLRLRPGRRLALRGGRRIARVNANGTASRGSIRRGLSRRQLIPGQPWEWVFPGCACRILCLFLVLAFTGCSADADAIVVVGRRVDRVHQYVHKSCRVARFADRRSVEGRRFRRPHLPALACKLLSSRRRDRRLAAAGFALQDSALTGSAAAPRHQYLDR